MKIIFTTAIIALVTFGVVYGGQVEDCMRTKGNLYYAISSCESVGPDEATGPCGKTYDVSGLPIH